MNTENNNTVRRPVIIIEESNANLFETKMAEALANGYKIIASNIGFVQSERYDFCSSYQAMLKFEGTGNPKATDRELLNALVHAKQALNNYQVAGIANPGNALMNELTSAITKAKGGLK